ncbi:hypothetical protein UlMin_035873 [Ulmus minor]
MASRGRSPTKPPPPPSLDSDDQSKRVSMAKSQVTKKRPALGNITNQKNGPDGSGSRIASSKPMVPCVAKIAKTKNEFSTCSRNSNLSECDLPTSLGLKSTALIPSSNTSSLGDLQPSEGATMLLSPSIKSIVLNSPSSIIPSPRRTNASPCKSVSGSVSLDESMSSCDSQNSPELDYIDKEEGLTVKNIARKTNNSCYISDDLKIAGSNCKRDVFAEMEKIDEVVHINNLMDPKCSSSIASEIYQYLLTSEARKRPSVDVLERIQKDINASMRAILVDWLVEVAEEYRLVPDTLFLSVNYIDRYLSGNVMKREKLQLLGIACMMIAAKYEEISAPHVEEFCYITDNTYLKKEVLQMESSVLNYLKFEMSAPTTICFLRRLLNVAQRMGEVPSIQLESMARYLSELSLLDYGMLFYSPSLIAASAFFLAKYIFLPSERPWNSTLMRCTLYQASDLCNCVKALHHLCCCGGYLNLSAIREKYSQHKYKSVADKKYCPPSIPVELFQDLSNN